MFNCILMYTLWTGLEMSRIIAEWEHAVGSMIRWPFGIPDDLVLHLQSLGNLYVLTQNADGVVEWFESESSMENVSIVQTPTSSHWTRDYGPNFYYTETDQFTIDHDFNGYPEESGCELTYDVSANKAIERGSRGFDWSLDDGSTSDFAKQYSWNNFALPYHFTGGNIVTDGYGSVFSTEVMLSENQMTADEFGKVLKQYLNVNRFVALPNPNVMSIQHIDCMVKFVNAETILIKKVDESNIEFECTENIVNIFRSMLSAFGRPYVIHRIYCPSINGASWENNPTAAYVNSYVMNSNVMVPLYGIVDDGVAMDVYRSIYPGYNVIGFLGRPSNPWYGEDALHCRVMAIYEKNLVHIAHKKILQDYPGLFFNASLIVYGDAMIGSAHLYVYENGVLLRDIEFEKTLTHFERFDWNLNLEYVIDVVTTNGVKYSDPSVGRHSIVIEIGGDTNRDGLLNVLDIVLLVNMILEGEYIVYGDINFDSKTNVLDIVSIVNEILS